jgi:integrase/recombinase XerD
MAGYFASPQYRRSIMAQPSQPISPLRLRMIEDMHIRKLAPKTQSSYILGVKKLADFMGHSPHTATAEDLRQFQLDLTNKGTSHITINATITALRFFFDVTVDNKDIVAKLSTVPVPRRLPIILSREEVSRLLEATHSLKYKAAFSVAYGACLLISEVAGLRISDIDSERKTLHVEQGKGRRIVMPCSRQYYWISYVAGGVKVTPLDYYSMAGGCFLVRTRLTR